MTDTRKLLEMAAKACGIHLHHWNERLDCWMTSSVEGDDPDSTFEPHTDDGDSARMRSALGINVAWYGNLVECSTSAEDSTDEWTELVADHNNDRNAALRRCALRVAAAMGERM